MAAWQLQPQQGHVRHCSMSSPPQQELGQCKDVAEQQLLVYCSDESLVRSLEVAFRRWEMLPNVVIGNTVMPPDHDGCNPCISPDCRPLHVNRLTCIILAGLLLWSASG